MIASQQALPGMEAGRRTERVEWGLRQTIGTFLMRKGDVDLRTGEDQARECAVRAELGWRGTEVVRRTVVTYTTSWESIGLSAEARP
jgi:hypothetical protein